MDNRELRQLAIVGVKLEIERLNTVLQQLSRGPVGRKPTSVTTAAPAVNPTPNPRRRRPMSAAAKKRISQRMKALWASKRKAAQ